MTDPIDTDDPVLHRALGVAANNSTWELLDARTSPDDFTPDEIDDVLARAYASTYHWARAADRTPANQARGAWLVSRVHAVLGHGELALHHAGIPLALFIVLQDYRFLMADVFVRGLAAVSTASLMTILAVIVSDRPESRHHRTGSGLLQK